MLGLGSAGRLCGHGQPAWRWGAHPLAGQPQLPHRSPGVQGSCKAPEGPGIRPPCSVLGGRGRGGASQPRFQGPGSRPQVLRGEQCGFSGAELGAGAGGHGALPLGLVLLLCLCGWSKVCSYRLRLDVLSFWCRRTRGPHRASCVRSRGAVCLPGRTLCGPGRRGPSALDREPAPLPL